MAAATILEGANHAWSGLSLEELRRGAKALVDGGLTRIPDRYILPPHQRPNYSQVLSCDNIPVIDLAGLDSGYENRAQVITDIAKACQNWGFYQVVNHGVPFAVMQKSHPTIS
ncbi:hypothetical protein O6H91_02G035200 [Diphasiastrum complanatum]|uniref:Uncharacterized protein n=1 Tax=Diphasiastrum complanatum TaxID=34168 RepID=A0ACC2EEE1_DIPCM|nr:hypothetical protein O6H91_02G035200 [Diphasiastrum complanatum]